MLGSHALRDTSIEREDRRIARAVPAVIANSDMADEAPKSPPSVFDHLALMLDQMAAVSWQKLGLQPDPITSKMDRNLHEAKVAIDTSAFLANALEQNLDEEDRKRVHSLITNLRINFVQKTNEGET